MIGGMVCGTPVVSHEHSRFVQFAAIVRREPEQVHPEPVPRGLLDQPAHGRIRSLADVVDRRLLRRPQLWLPPLLLPPCQADGGGDRAKGGGVVRRREAAATRRTSLITVWLA